MKSSKINLRFCKIAPGPILSPEYIYSFVIFPTQLLAPIQPIQEVHETFIVATRNLENLPEVDVEEVEPVLGTPRLVSRNPNIRNDVNCHGMKRVENNSLAKERSKWTDKS